MDTLPFGSPPVLVPVAPIWARAFPVVAIAPTTYAGPPAYTAYQVTVTLSWQMPDEYNTVPRPPAHRLAFTTLIPCC